MGTKAPTDIPQGPGNAPQLHNILLHQAKCVHQAHGPLRCTVFTTARMIALASTDNVTTAHLLPQVPSSVSWHWCFVPYGLHPCLVHAAEPPKGGGLLSLTISGWMSHILVATILSIQSYHSYRPKYMWEYLCICSILFYLFIILYLYSTYSAQGGFQQLKQVQYKSIN